LIDNKHNHKKVLIKQELEAIMNDWKIFVDNVKRLKHIIETHYTKHEPLVKYLDKENLMKVDLAVKAPTHNISQDVENFI